MLLCYADEDQRLVNQFKQHLNLLKHNGLIVLWDRGDISSGAERQREIDTYLNEAQIILLCISASFLGSEYYLHREMQRAIKRHESKEARVIPIILRPVNWNEAPLDKLEDQALPTHDKAISIWPSRDSGFKHVVDGLKKVIEQWNTHSLPGPRAEREVLMTNFDQLIESVKLHMQPPPRAMATAKTLQQLLQQDSIFIPNDVTLADLVVGWQTLARAAKKEDEPATSQRRVTCGELAALAAPLTTEQGSLAQAIKTWRVWSDAFQRSDDPRQIAMSKTFTRELAELQEAAQ